MDDAFAVGVPQPRECVPCDADGLVQRHPLAPGPELVLAGAQGVAFEQFHDHVVQAVLRVEIEDLDDVGVPQSRNGVGLAAETFQEFRFIHQVGA